MTTTDLLIVGGGPAGLAVAMAARAHGLQVMVADQARPTIDKACGEGLMPDALSALEALGVGLDARDGALFRGIRFLGYGSEVRAQFPRGTGLGVRRTHLHAKLTEHTAETGAVLRWGAGVTDLADGLAQVDGEPVAFRYLVGADGGNSAVRRWAGMDHRRRDGLRYGFRRHYFLEPWTDYVEVHWAPACQVYVTPVASDCICVAALVRGQDQRLDQVLTLFPELSARLAQAREYGPERGGLSAFRRLDRVVRGDVALAGDASGSVDAVTGEGLALAFRQASALAGAMAKGRLEQYQGEHERIRQGPDWMATLLLMMDRSDFLGRRALKALAHRPDVFASMLAAHVGKPSPATFAGALCSLGWSLLTV
jgi:menaquinone-9 beta-reductase